MSRPKKPSREPLDMRTDEQPGDVFAAIDRQAVLNQLRADPFGDEPLACILGPVILGRATAADKQLTGEIFAAILETSTPDQLAAFFARIHKMKVNADMPPHRNAFAYYAYSNYIGETGREPSKQELRKYITARREIYKDAPQDGPDDGKAWHRLWQDCGLFELPKKQGMKP
jgi:hypothetical protein